MNEYLPPPELHALTSFARVSTQVEWLAAHGIPHRQDGKRVIVSRFTVRKWLEGCDVSEPPPATPFDWRDYILLPNAVKVQRHKSHPTATYGVYALFNAHGVLLYIGKTTGLNERMLLHFYLQKISFTYYSAIEVPLDEMTAIEIAHICALRPMYNGIYQRVSHPDHSAMVEAIEIAWNVQKEPENE